MNLLPGLKRIQLSVTDMCNRKCIICPHVDEEAFPNNKVWMSLSTAEKLAQDLERCKYQGLVSISGYGEPLLHPGITEIISKFTSRHIKTRLLTNADLLFKDKISCTAIDNLGLTELKVSTYDGPDQHAEYSNFINANFKSTKITMVNNYIEEFPKESVAEIFTNRAGTLYKTSSFQQTPCYLPLHHIQIDWDGTVLICCHDWKRQIKYDNINDTPFEDIWVYNKKLNQHRNQLIDGQRTQISTCTDCSYTNENYSTVPVEWVDFKFKN